MSSPLTLSPSAGSPPHPAPRPSVQATADHLNRSAIMLKAHAAVRWMIVMTDRAMTHRREYAQHLGRAARLAWDAAYEAAALAGEIDPAAVEKRRQRQKAAERKRIANSPLIRGLQAIVARHAASAGAAA